MEPLARFRGAVPASLLAAVLLVAAGALHVPAVRAASCSGASHTMELGDGTADPGSGSPSTAFHFSVTVRDNADCVPDQVSVTVAGRTVGLGSPAATSDGIRYTATVKLPAGRWSYFFTAASGSGPGRRVVKLTDVAPPAVVVAAPSPAATPRPTAPPTAAPTVPPPTPTAAPTPRPTPTATIPPSAGPPGGSAPPTPLASAVPTPPIGHPQQSGAPPPAGGGPVESAAPGGIAAVGGGSASSSGPAVPPGPSDRGPATVLPKRPGVVRAEASFQDGRPGGSTLVVLLAWVITLLVGAGVFSAVTRHGRHAPRALLALASVASSEGDDRLQAHAVPPPGEGWPGGSAARVATVASASGTAQVVPPWRRRVLAGSPGSRRYESQPDEPTGSRR